ncbi:unnamed protein product, partial [Prorocentrum cordatum]
KPHAESSNNTSEVLVRIVLSWPWSGDYAHGVGKVSPKAEAPSVQGSPLGPLSEDQSYTPPPQQAAAPRRRSATPGTTCTSGTRRRA